MQDYVAVIQSIERKVKKVMLDYELEKERNILVLKEKQQLLNTIEEQGNIINQLEEKNKLLKIKNSVENSSNSKEAKLRINELVREIDKCIELLSTN